MTGKPFAFVVMPFSKEFVDIYEFGIATPARSLGFKVARVDEQIFYGEIPQQIISQIRSADVLIAVLSGDNTGVYWELGYAASAGKTCITVTSNVGSVHFNVKSKRHIVYTTAVDLRNKINIDLKYLKPKIIKLNSEKLHGTSLTRPEFENKLEEIKMSNADALAQIVERFQNAANDLKYIGGVGDAVRWFAENNKDLLIVRKTVYRHRDKLEGLSIPYFPEFEKAVMDAVRSGCEWVDLAFNGDGPFVKATFERISEEDHKFFDKKYSNYSPPRLSGTPGAFR